MKNQKKNRIWLGISASPGIAIGRVYRLDREEIRIKEEDLSSDQVENEILRFNKALNEAKIEISKLKDSIAKKLGPEHAKLFEAYLLILEDEFINQQVFTGIREEKKNAEFIYNRVVQKTIQTISLSRDEYLKERVADISAVSNRVLNRLLGRKQHTIEPLETPGIIVAHSLAPGDVVQMKKGNVLGFATDTGGKTSHVALLAKSLGFPAVVGLKTFFYSLKGGEMLILDGEEGEIILSPDELTLKSYEAKREKLLERKRSLAELTSLLAETKDKRKIELSANIELLSDVDTAIENGAQGIGLFRTEYLYLVTSDLPGEEEQYQAYSSLARKVHPQNAIIRTFDMGGDKFAQDAERVYEANPFLGWRAIRACLDLPDFFKIQLRAILKASSLGNLRIMLPMISGLEELLKSKELLEEVKSELREKKVPFDEKIKLGIMIEIPSAALEADSLAQHCDFFSIGTNDLIQYTLAVDRTNERIAHLYQSFHPSILKLIKKTIEDGHKNNIWVGMCGEMANDPKATAFLIGLGIDELSTSPLAIPQIKKIIRSIEFEEARNLVEQAMKLNDSKDIERFLDEDYQRKFSHENSART
ncbi:MAG: phosphoenolpyruvate--protein phosphotransferase [candidate division Zixibacteria bacterium]|nr:phosphoenolpyruvate--protein phosphotransferase [candidate division Zixibacteria bacterium]